ncbi:MAG TPA: GGDEF domain-containing protein [Noviherbaspirillum sp.]
MESPSSETIEALLQKQPRCLSFPEDVERYFQHTIKEKRIRHVFLTSLLGAVIYLFFAVSDYMLLTDIYREVWAFRFLIAFPLFMAACFIFPRIESYKLREAFVVCTAWAIGAATAWLVAQSKSPFVAQQLSGFCLFMVYSNVVLRFRFTLTLIISVVFMLFFAAVSFTADHIPFVASVNNLILLSSTAAMSLVGNYWHERQERHSFLLAERDAARKKELQRANDTLEGLSFRDGLTAVYNKRYFDMHFPRLLREAQDSSRPLCVLFIDVDHFKNYNDTYGHIAGDEALKRVADLINRHFRRRDEVIARTGGEEFVGLLPGLPRDQAREFAEKIRDSVERLGLPHAHSAAAPVVTVSIGIAVARPGQPATPESVLKAADAALYEAKHQGRNRVVLYPDTGMEPVDRESATA